MRGATTAAPADVDWTVTVTEPLPDCPSVEACWEKLATQTTWSEWRSPSKLRGADVITTNRPPSDGTPQGGRRVRREGREVHEDPLSGARAVLSGYHRARWREAVFDATGVALGGIVKARFRFTVFRGEDGVVTARAQERMRIAWSSVLAPSRETLEDEHRHTFTRSQLELPLPVAKVGSPARRQLEVLRTYIRAGSVAAAACELGISFLTLVCRCARLAHCQ